MTKNHGKNLLIVWRQKKKDVPKDLPEIYVYYKDATEFFKSNNSIDSLLVIDLNNIDLERI